MKKAIPWILAAAMLAGCTSPAAPDGSTTGISDAPLINAASDDIALPSRFETETVITLSDSGIRADSAYVHTSHDIIYYEDRTTYDSGNPYGEGTQSERHTAQEAAEHTVVNITAPGRYRISGKLSRGQILVDLGKEAKDDPNARVELILDGCDITCTVAPAILFMNTYECDGDWSTDTAKPDVDTADAGAVLALEGKNYVSGAHIARIYKDSAEQKKLWKMDGAIYSYMSLNVYGPGSLDLTADNEGLDTELHLTINGGRIAIRSQDDGINTNEDGVSVTTINGGNVHIIAGLGKEGDGIDSNGYLVINGGIVVSAANPGADAGLDSDLGSYINGGTVVALGSTMDWAESDSNQVTMNLQFAAQQSSGDAITVTRTDGTVLFAYDPSEDEILGTNVRQFQGAVISSPNFAVGESYHVYLGGTVAGSDDGGVYAVTTVTDVSGGVQQSYTGSDLRGGPGGMGGVRPEKPGEWNGQRPPEGDQPDWAEGERPDWPDGEKPEWPGDLPDNAGPEPPKDNFPDSPINGTDGTPNSLFFMQDKVNAFSGITNQ